MAKIVTISSDTTTVLLKKGIDSGNLNRVIISNNHHTTTNVCTLQLHNGSSATVLYKLEVPAQVAVVLEHGVAFDSKKHRMELITSTTAPITVIFE
mgnify:CR=1 FL=1